MIKTKIRILHIDDNSYDRLLVKDALQRENDEFEVTEAPNREIFEKYIAEDNFDIVLSDFNILGYDGLQVLEKVRDKKPNLPVIIVTGTGSEEIAIQAMKMGAADYVLKSVKHIQGLAPTIKTVLAHRKSQDDRKKAEEALRISEKKYRKLHESMIDGFSYIDMNGKILEYNESFQRMLGYNSQEILQLTYLDITPEKWHEFESGIIKEQVLIKGYSDVYEKEYIKKDGCIFPVELRTFLVKNENGENDGMWAIVRDITERKRAEEALRKSESRFRSYFESSVAGIAIITTTRSMIVVNECLCEMLGYTRDELRRITWAQLTHPDDVEEDNDFFSSISNGLIEDYSIDKRFIRKGGDILWTSFSAKGVRFANGTIDYFIALLFDISRRKQIEEENLVQIDELEYQLKEKSFQLLLANKETEALASLLSDDLKSGLVGMTEFADLLEKEAGNVLHEKIREAGRDLKNNSQRLLKSIDGVIEFSQIKQQVINVSSVDMENLANLVFNALSNPAMRKKIEFKVGPLPFAKGDASLIKRVWENLISNAIKFSSFQEVSKIEISAKKGENETTYIISDNGIGFDMKHSHKLFGLFQKIHDSKDNEGTGLGLAIVDSIIRKHGGKVRGEGKVNQGAVFYFSLPNK